jgi:hypothetical protein
VLPPEYESLKGAIKQGFMSYINSSLPVFNLLFIKTKQMKKLLTLMAVVLLGFTSCQKETLNKPEDKSNTNLDNIPPSITARINILQQSQTVYFATKVNTNQVYEPMTVKIIHWDYNNGHTPMIVTGRDSFQINRMPGIYIQHMRNTGFTYTGNMEVKIYQDSLNLLKYSRTVMLTDSLGWTVNWDTTAHNQYGWVGQNRIVDVLPKHYQ